MDVYVDKEEIIADCIEELDPFIQDVLPKEVDVETRNYVEVSTDINNKILNSLIEKVTENCEYKLIKCDDCNKEAEIMDNYWQER